jgi:hypothetical protein
MSMDAKEFASNVVAKLDFSTPQSIKEGVAVALTATLGELATRDKMIRGLQDELIAVKASIKPKPETPREIKSFKGTPFTGEKDSPDVAEFLQQVKLFVEMNSYTAAQHKKVLLSGLRGTAHKAVTNWLEEPTHTAALVVEIEAFLKTRFEDSTKSDEADRWIQTAQQRGSVRRFNQIFQKKLSQIKPALPAPVQLRAYLRALNPETAKLLWAMKVANLEAAMDTAANLETLEDRDILSNPTPRRQTPGRERAPPPSTFRPTPRKLDFGAIRIPSSLSEEQKKLWKEGKCIWCREQFNPGHKFNCKKKPRVNEVDVEEDVDDNKNINEYGSFLPRYPNRSLRPHYPNVSQVRGPEVARKDEMVEGQRYDRKAKREPEFEIDLNMSKSV